MKLEQRIGLMVRLGEHLLGEDEGLQEAMHRSEAHNPWFTLSNQRNALESIARYFLNRQSLETWLAAYSISEPPPRKTVGIVMAGNIPLVGFHDWLCVFLAGHRAQVRLSEKDAILFPYILSLLRSWEPETDQWTGVVEQLKGFDAVIATGSNNSARYFEAYFGKKPNIIRRNRNGVAVLSGEESAEDLRLLGRDVFSYFGLGCRNVSKLYVSQGYSFEPLLAALDEYREVAMNNKYKNNYDYNYAVFIINKIPHLSNGSILLKEDHAIASTVGCLHYAWYGGADEIARELEARKEEIQCVVAKPGLLSIPTIGFGETQTPVLGDYADGVDTMEFLSRLA